MNREIPRLEIPNIISNVSVPLLGIVDSVMVGHMEVVHFIGSLVVGTMIFNFIFFGLGVLSMLTSGLTAQAWGAGNRNEASYVFWSSQAFALFMGLMLILLQFPIARLGFYFVESYPEILYYALEYFFIRILAAPATLSLLGIQGWFIGVQNSCPLMMITVVINMLNIFANFIFVYGLEMKIQWSRTWDGNNSIFWD